MALGSAIGSTIGGIGGAAIGGPIGAQIGAGIGGIAGGAIDLAGQKTPEVQMADPNQIARLREIESTKKQIASGTDPLTQQAVSDIRKTGETTKGQLAKFTGGDVGGTLSAMLRAQRNIGQGQNQAYAQSQQRLPFFENLQSQLGNRIAQRKLELDVNAQDTAKAERANTQRQIIGSVSGLIGSGVGALGSGAQAGQMGGSLGGGGGVNSLGQFNPGTSLPTITAPQLNPAFQQGLSGTNGMGGFGQTLGGGFGG